MAVTHGSAPSVLGSLPEVGWSERRAAERVRATLFGGVERPLLPRYVLERSIGRGAMGEVWRARDPELERSVAIKLLLPSREIGGAALDRLAREARSLARLSHPNVVQVFDLGTYCAPGGERGLFIVMELVDGAPLSSWLEQRQRSWREIVDVFVEAGRGLAAAHDVGMVHRDFKPGNVLVGRRDDGLPGSGRVRVGDFGLARLADLSGAEHRAVELREQQGELAATLGGDLTNSGDVVGTPLYMAPEQHQGGAIGPRADLYAFCVALYEAVLRARPFPGGLHPMIEAKLVGEIAPPGRNAVDVPESLRALIVRGLAPRPADRWPSMHELVAALQRVRQGRTRTRWMIGLGVAALAVAAVGATMPTACNDDGVAPRRWDSHHRARAHQGLAAALPPDRSAPATEALDRWFDGFVGASASACRVDPARTTERWDCLRRAAMEFDAVVAALGDATADGATSTALVASLPDPAVCGDRAAASTIPPGLRAQADEVTARLTESRVALDVGQPQRALALAESTRHAVLDGDRPRAGLATLVPDVWFAIGVAYEDLHLYGEAEAELVAAHAAAIEHDDATVASHAALRLAQLTSSLDRPDEATKWLAHAAAAEATLPVAERVPAAIAMARGVAAFHAFDHAAAIRHFSAAIDACREVACGDVASSARSNLARSYSFTGDHRNARIAWLDAGDVASSMFGPASPSAMTARIYAADALIPEVPLGALDEVEAVLAELDAAPQVDAEVLAQAWQTHAEALESLGRADEALGSALRAVAAARTEPALVELRAVELGRAANIAARLGRHDRALALVDETLAIAPPWDRQLRLGALVSRGIIAYELRRWAAGHADHIEALAIAIELFGPVHPDVVTIEGNLADAMVLEGRAAEALEHYDRGLAVAERLGGGEAAEALAAALRRRRSECVAASVAGTPPGAEADPTVDSDSHGTPSAPPDPRVFYTQKSR